MSSAVSIGDGNIADPIHLTPIDDPKRFIFRPGVAAATLVKVQLETTKTLIETEVLHRRRN